MMHPLRPNPITVVAALVGVVALGAPLAQAEPFGGFSSDETEVLVGRDTICTPLAITDGKSTEVPRCRRADGRQVAARKFRRGTQQLGSKAKYAAATRSTTLTIRALASAGSQGGSVVTWESTDPIARVVGVHLSEGGRLLAIEYESRFGGRARVDVVAFVMASERPPAVEPPGPETGATKPPQPAAPAPPASPASKEQEQALSKARNLSKRNRHKAAIAAFRQVLALDRDHSEARYFVARHLARQRKTEDALRELDALAASSRPDAIEWRVEARFDKAFTRLRSSQRFREAVGLDSASAATSTYERLLGFTSTWEQPEIKCEQAAMNIDFARRARTFALRVTSRCGGYPDRARFKGRWTIDANDRIVLTLPNKKGPNEVIACEISACGDGSGEQCLACGVDADLSFIARPVRR